VLFFEKITDIYRPLQHFINTCFGLEHFNADLYKAFKVEAHVNIFRYELEIRNWFQKNKYLPIRLPSTAYCTVTSCFMIKLR
jgi:hypothetical protein